MVAVMIFFASIHNGGKLLDCGKVTSYDLVERKFWETSRRLLILPILLLSDASFLNISRESSSTPSPSIRQDVALKVFLGTASRSDATSLNKHEVAFEYFYFQDTLSQSTS